MRRQQTFAEVCQIIFRPSENIYFLLKGEKDEAENLIITLRCAGIVPMRLPRRPVMRRWSVCLRCRRWMLLLDQSLQSVGGIVLSDPNVQNPLERCAGRQTSSVGSSLEKYTTQLIAEINTPQVRAQLHKAALEGIKTVYTQEEVNALIDFTALQWVNQYSLKLHAILKQQ